MGSGFTEGIAVAILVIPTLISFLLGVLDKQDPVMMFYEFIYDKVLGRWWL